jgi:hypothetical protein
MSDLDMIEYLSVGCSVRKVFRRQVKRGRYSTAVTVEITAEKERPHLGGQITMQSLASVGGELLV